MPYTKEELKDLAFYQNLINEDEQNYLIERERLQTLVAVSGSGYDGGLLTRDASGTIKLFENPYTGELYDDETSTLFVPKVVDRLKDDDSINEILNRNIREL
tara:strand:+ start:961 stop:1266 length:306 start_codon:yes stop_codon:yes gene_type:complete